MPEARAAMAECRITAPLMIVRSRQMCALTAICARHSHDRHALPDDACLIMQTEAERPYCDLSSSEKKSHLRRSVPRSLLCRSAMTKCAMTASAAPLPHAPLLAAPPGPSVIQSTRSPIRSPQCRPAPYRARASCVPFRLHDR